MRVDRTFAFLDLNDFTAFTESAGDQRAVEVLAGFRHVVRDAASEHGVRVAKWLGDGAMFVGVTPVEVVTTVVQVVASFEAAGWPLHIRAGVAGGPVILFEGDDHIGTPVNLAARLCDVARPGTVLVSADVPLAAPGALPPGVAHAETALVRVPGLVLPVEVVHLTPVGLAAV